MKNLAVALFVFLFLAITPNLFAQNVSINADGSLADTSAMLDVSSTTKGLLLPRMTTTQQNAIILPANGLTIFNTTLNSIMINTGNSTSPVWSAVTSGSIDTSSITNFSTKVRSLFSSTTPITYSNGLIGITQSGTSTNGYLSSTDWNTFNSKGSGNGTVTSVSVTTANGVSGTVATSTTTPAISLTLGAITPSSVAATGTVTGSNLSGTNTGNVTIGTANGLSIAAQALSLGLSSISTTGALSSTDWNTFNSKGGGSVTSVTSANGNATVATTTTTPVITIVSAPKLQTARNIQGVSFDGTANINIINGTGFVKATGTTISYDNSTYLTANQTISFAPTGDVTGSTTGTTTIAPALVIGTNKVLNTMLAQMPTLTIKGNNTGGTANPSDLTVAQVNAILPVFTSTLNGLVPFSGGSAGKVLHADGIWRDTASAGNQWSVTGNSGTSYLTNFLGTTDNKSLRFRTNNTQQMKIDSLGNVAVGQDTLDPTNPEKFIINAGTTSSVNGLVVKGAIDNYFQFNIKNKSTGTTATTDIVATADNGTETTNYVDLGINGSNYNAGAIETGVANDGYLISAAKDFYLVNSTPNKNLLFLTGGTGVANERLRILANGYVGLGVQDPGAQFVVKDTIQIRRTGAVSQLLFTNTSGSGDFRIGGDGGDLFWQGGGGRDLQMGSYWATILTGDRQTSVYPGFISNTSGTGVIVLGQRDASVPLGIQANSGSQSANLTEWRNSSGTVLDAFDKSGNLGVGNSSPSQKLDVTGNVKFSGALMPNNAAGTAGYVLTSNGAGSAPSWSAPSSSGWSLTGNASTTGSNFLGTTDNTNLYFRTNNTQAVEIDNDGSVGIGASPSFLSGTDKELFLVDGGNSTTTNTVMNATGTINDYLQMNIQNNSNGNKASSDVVATANNGSLSTVYIDMGINSQGYSNSGSNILNGANTAYLYATGSDFYIGNGANNKDLVFFTNSSGTTGTNGTERARITSAAFQPGANNTYSLGTSTRKWTAVYAQNGTIQTSDRRLKTNIKDLHYGLKEVLAMRPVSYNWIDTTQKGNKIGLIAQEVRKIVPEVVVGDESKENIGMNYAELVPVLINAIKDQQKQIDELKKTMEELKNQK